MSKINKSPVLTSQNYGINYFDFDEGFLDFSGEYNFKVNMPDDTISQIDIREIKGAELPQNNLSVDINTMSQKECAFAKKIVFNKDTKKPFCLEFEVLENSTFSNALIFEIKEGVSAQIVVDYMANDTASHVSTIQVLLGKNAKVDLIVLSKMSGASAGLLSLETKQQENSTASLSLVDFAGKNSVQNIKVNLIDNTAKAFINSLYVGEKKGKLSLNYVANVIGKKCQASINALGLLFDECEKNFIGTINFERGASKSDGEENEFCFLLSNKAKAKSTPILLSKEDDANGKHSSSVGKIDAKKMFYANTRGLSAKDATKIFVKAKISKFLQNIFDENLKAEIDKYIDRRIENENM